MYAQQMHVYALKNGTTVFLTDVDYEEYFITAQEVDRDGNLKKKIARLTKEMKP